MKMMEFCFWTFRFSSQLKNHWKRQFPLHHFLIRTVKYSKKKKRFSLWLIINSIRNFIRFFIRTNVQKINYFIRVNQLKRWLNCLIFKKNRSMRVPWEFYKSSIIVLLELYNVETVGFIILRAKWALICLSFSFT